ncbi:MAG: HisS family protein [Dehalococcoidia bacterium]
MGETIRSRGMRDILPDEMERFRRIESSFRDVCLGWGYAEVRTPTIEHLFLFTSAGTLSPQMLDRVYSFLDWDGWSGERVVLRPDSTIPTVRLFEENMPDKDDAKLFYVQNVFRFEQGDASREDWQCGVELLGDTFPHGDIELILMATEVASRLGVDVGLKLSHPGIVRAVLDRAGLTPPEQAGVYDRILASDHAALDALGGKLSLKQPVSGLLAMEGDGPEYLHNLRAMLASNIPGIEEPLAQLQSVSSVIAGLGVPHQISPLGVRDFEYYTGPVFSLEIDGVRIGGGGRYDSLAGLIGGRPTPASGFALEMERLAERIPAAAALGPTVTIRRTEGGELADAFRLASALRESNLGIGVTVGAQRSQREVIVSGVGFTLNWNDGSPRKCVDADEVAKAVAEALAQDR